MACSSGSRGRGQGNSAAGGDAALDTLTNPNLAHLPAVDLVARLNREDRSGSDFADVALVLAVRERRLAEVEDRVRAADVVAAGLRDTIRALELRAANAEALARRKRNSLGSDSGGISGGERAVAHEDDQRSLACLEPQIGAAELTRGEIRARDLTASEIEDGECEITHGVCFGAGVKAATPAEVGDSIPRPSPLRRIGATLPAASSMPDVLALAKERAVERVVVEQAAGVVESRDEVSEVVAGKRKQEPAAAASASEYKEQQPLKKKPKPAGALGVASEDSDSDTQAEEAEEELRFTEAQGWEMLGILKAQVAAWEAVYDAADAAEGTLQAAATPPPVEEVQTVIEAEAREETSEATVARLQEEVTLSKRRLEEVKDRAEKTEERLCAEITKWKDEATKTETVLWEEILLARSSAATELEVWKHSATEAQAQIRAATTTVARLYDELEAWKHRASEAETRLQTTQDKINARLQDKVVEGECKLAKAESSRIRVSDELVKTEQDSAIEVAAQIRRATMIEEHLPAKISTLEVKVTNLEARGSDISRSDRTVVIDEHGKSPMVSEIGVHRVVPTGATKIKAQRQKGVSFYDKIFKSEMEKKKLIGNEENEESLKKQAAVIASKELYLRCWSQAPYLPSQLGSQTMEEDSGEEA